MTCFIDVRTPGSGPALIFVSSPEDIKTVLTQDGDMPYAFQDESVWYGRTLLPDKFPTYRGLVAQGQDWLEFRRAVQQDMLKPTAAQEYFENIYDLVDSVINQILERRDGDLNVADIHTLTQEYALDGIGRMFFGTNLHTLQGNQEGKKLLNLNKQLFEVFSAAFFLSQLPWLYQRSPYLRRLLRVQAEIADIGNKSIKLVPFHL